MDIAPPPNREDFESDEAFELALKKWENTFKQAKKPMAKKGKNSPAIFKTQGKRICDET